jgi:2-C-methyl-D-erythritol 4-phosphate cytidylyltransferase
VVLLLAAGEGARLGAQQPKVLFDLDGAPLVRYAFEAIEDASLVDAIVVACPSGYEKRVEALIGATTKPVTIVVGGTTRQSSAAAALAAAPDAEAYLVHDAARPLAPASLFDACLRELDECDAVCPATPVKDTIKETSGAEIVRTVDRSLLVAAQTPQGFRADVYRKAHELAKADGFDGTDDASLIERLGVAVRIIPGDDRNIKVTTKHDADVAAMLLKAPR